MRIRELVFLLEERSAEALLRMLLPRLLPANLPVRYLVFEGKRDLENNISSKLQNYLVPGARFVILRDQDSGDCHEIKEQLRKLCANSGRPHVVIHIACRELESWYLGDLAAVERAFPSSKAGHLQKKAKFRAPDRLNNAAAELSRIVPGYQKVSGSRDIAAYMSLENNCSHSFRVFVRAVRLLGCVAIE